MTDLRFDPPGPGSWALDAAHCDRPRSHDASDLFNRVVPEGFREGFARYGVLLDTLDFRSVGPFPYMQARPLGAPPGAGGPPPKWIFKILVAVHPALRARVKRAREVVDGKVWREDLGRFWRELPAAEAAIAALASEPIEALDDLAFVDYLERVGSMISRRMFEHFRNVPVSLLPVGDFLAYAVECGAAPHEAIAVLRGHSPASVAAGRALADAAAAIASDPRARTVLASAQAPDRTLAELRHIGGPVGAAVGRLLDRYGDAILSGFDLTELRLVELPVLVIAALRARATHTSAPDTRPNGQDPAAVLRARVPEPGRAIFDERLAEARVAYPLRDAQSNVDLWALGVTRRALLEAGRRLLRAGKIEREDDVFDATHAEIVSFLKGEPGPASAEIAARAHVRRTSKLADAPMFLGPPPGEPPPADWLPPYAARLTRAFGIYRTLMEEPAESRDATIVRGVGASAGRSRGTARLVLSAADFDKLQQGDILVANTTTPSYNVILPLLGGIITDRGGLLSHAAIVSREYGFPGIVGTHDATKRIPDGALIEIDGDAGTARVLAV